MFIIIIVGYTINIFNLHAVFSPCRVSRRLLPRSASQSRPLCLRSEDGLAAAERPANVPVLSVAVVSEPSKAKCRVSAVLASFGLKNLVFWPTRPGAPSPLLPLFFYSVHANSSRTAVLRNPSSDRLTLRLIVLCFVVTSTTFVLQNLSHASSCFFRPPTLLRANLL